MTTIVSDPSPTHDDSPIPTATLALPYVGGKSSSRRLPPPCWSSDETLALIEAYKEKWYSLHRGNLRANHWQEVADDVASRYQASPPKTAVQCRHKMEKLRKRYRTEIQRAAAQGGVRRFSSSWVHFHSMHGMEKGPNNHPSPPSTDDEEEGEDKYSVKRFNDLYSNNHMSNFSNQGSAGNGIASGVRIKIPGMATMGPVKAYDKFYEIGDQSHNNHNPRFSKSVAGAYGIRDGFMERENRFEESPIKRKAVDGGVNEVVEAIQSLGEIFMRMEKVKMDMARQVEEMRMKMELKRTDMILESQQRIVEAFAKSYSERSSKKVKRLSTPECANA